MTHHVFEVDDVDAKNDLVKTLASGTGRRILFMRTKHHAKKLAKKLTEQGIPAVDLHGNLSQPQRDRNLAAFGDGSVKVLVATDVAARGVHVDNVELVIHVDPPTEHKAYLHRSGRTARAGSEGDVVTDRAARAEAGPEDAAPQGRDHGDARSASPPSSPARDRARRRRRAVREARPARRGSSRAVAAGRRARTPSASAPPATASLPPVRAAVAAVATAAAQTDVAPATPRRDRSGRPAETKAHAPKQGAGHSRGAQSSGAQRGASARSGRCQAAAPRRQPRLADAQQPSRAGLTPAHARRPRRPIGRRGLRRVIGFRRRSP